MVSLKLFFTGKLWDQNLKILTEWSSILLSICCFFLPTSNHFSFYFSQCLHKWTYIFYFPSVLSFSKDGILYCYFALFGALSIIIHGERLLTLFFSSLYCILLHGCPGSLAGAAFCSDPGFLQFCSVSITSISLAYNFYNCGFWSLWGYQTDHRGHWKFCNSKRFVNAQPPKINSKSST